MFGDQHDKNERRYGPALNQQQEAELTSRVAKVAAQAEHLFVDLERYDVIASVSRVTTKRSDVVDVLISSLQEHLRSSVTEQEATSEWKQEGREALLEKLSFLGQFRTDLGCDQRACEEWLTQARQEIVAQGAALRSAVDTLYSVEPTRGEVMPNDDKWNRVGKAQSGISTLRGASEEFSTAPIIDYVSGIMELVGAVETHYVLSCVRESAPTRREGIESVYRTRLGWRLGLPLSRGALRVSLSHLTGSERRVAEEFIEPKSEADGWVDADPEAEHDSSGSRAGEGSRDVYSGVVATREVYRPNSQVHEDLVVGAMLYHRMGNVCEINAIRVGDWERGQGVGAQLMTAFLRETRRQRDDVKIIIDLPHEGGVGYSHARMCSFLHSFGFTAIPTLLDGYTRMKWDTQLCAPMLD